MEMQRLTKFMPLILSKLNNIAKLWKSSTVKKKVITASVMLYFLVDMLGIRYGNKNPWHYVLVKGLITKINQNIVT